MWNKKYMAAVVLITASLIAIGAILWSRDASTVKLEPLSAGEYWRGDAKASVTADIYMDFG